MGDLALEFYTITKRRRSGGLLELLIAAQHLEASNPLDMVYALLGLLPPEQTFLQPDYNRTVRRLYIDVIVGGVEHSRDLAYISAGGIGHLHGDHEDLKGLISRLPSWVPDFSRTVWPLYLDHPFVPHVSEFDASKGKAAEYRFHSDDTILDVKGFVCGRIIRSGQLVVGDIEYSADLLQHAAEVVDHMARDTMKTLKNCVEIIGPDHPNHPFEDSLWMQALFRTLLPHISYVFPNEEGEYHCKSCFEQFSKIATGFMLIMADIGCAEGLVGTQRSDDITTLERPLLSPVATRDNLPLSYVESLLQLFFAPSDSSPEPESESIGDTFDVESVEQCGNAFALLLEGVVSRQTTFFVTSQGFYGISDAKVRDGDELCIVLGCPVPLAVRRLESDFVLVGACHVLGMMYGEMVEAMENGDFNIEILRFR